MQIVNVNRTLFLIIAVLLMPLHSWADESGTCGDNVTWTYSESTKTLTIEGTGAMENYGIVGGGVPWGIFKEAIGSVVIEFGVTSIGEWAFYYCSGLTSISIPNSVTTIGDAAFEDCSGLTSITIPNSVTNIGGFAFAYCSGLTSIKVDAGNLVYDSRNSCNAIIKKESNELIAGCKNTTIPNSVTAIGQGAFRGCSGLTSITIPNSVTTIGDDAFYRCSSLTSISIPNSVTTIGDGAFEGCRGLTTIVSEIQSPFSIDGSVFYVKTYSNAELIVPKGTKAMYQATTGWKLFKNIVENAGASEFTEDDITYTVTSENTAEVKETSGNLKRITIPQSVIHNGTTYRVTSIGESAFDGRDDLTYLSIPSSVTAIGSYAFIDCGSNIDVNIEDLGAWCNVELGNIHASPLSSSRALYVNGKEVKNLVIPEGVETISSFTFYQCRSITSLTIPSSVKKIDSSTFEDCTGLKSISLSEGLSDIGGSSFEGCTGISALTIPSSVGTISIRAFARCDNLNDITSEILKPFAINDDVFSTYTTATLIVPKGTKAMYQATEGWKKFKTIVENAGDSEFTEDDITYTVTSENTAEVKEASSNLKRITIPQSVTHDGTTYRVTSIGERAFDGRSDLTYLSIPSSVTAIGSYAFIDCGSNIDVNIEDLGAWCNVELGNIHASPLSSSRALYVNGKEVKNLVIPEGVETISSFTFYQCRSITSLTIPSSVKKIDSSSFEDCTSLKSISLSEGLSDIGGSSFEGCTGVSALTIPSSVGTISIRAFARCDNLNDITSEILKPFAINDDVFSTYTTATLIVPKGTKAMYQATEGWKKFKNIVEDNIIVTAKSYSREYGEANPTFTYTTSGGTLNGIPQIICEATKTSDVGTYAIKMSQGSITNKNVTYVDGTLTVNKAPLIITAKSYTREVGMENPKFEVTYSGFKNGETESVLTKKPIVSTNATNNSGAGTYDINVSGAEAKNYSISYEKGVLTVTEKEMISFTKDGITYAATTSNKKASVQSVETSVANVNIPKSVTYNGTSYIVSEISDYAFEGLTVNYIYVPSSITTSSEKTFSGCKMGALMWDAETALSNDAFKNSLMSTDSNFLLYVKSANNAPSSVQNVVVNGKAQSVLLSDKGGQFYCPEAFTANSISYSHNYYMQTGGNGKGWETLALPFDVQTISHATQGVIVPFASYRSGTTDKPFWLCEFTDYGFKRASEILANKAYIVAMPNSASYASEYLLSGKITYAASNVVVPKTTEYDDSFIPTYETVSKSSSVMALNVTNELTSKTGGYDAGSRFISNLRDIHPFEGYMINNGTRGVYIIGENNGTTDIMPMMDTANEHISIYTLNGQFIGKFTQQKFEQVWNELSCGIYIVNGKKRVK